jgi:CRP/FNR family transcriptional regulator
MLVSSEDVQDRAFFLLSGRVKVFQVAENGREVILEVVGRGGLVGDLALAGREVRTACAQAIDRVVAAEIWLDDLRERAHASPALAFAMMEQMAARLASMQQAFVGVVSKPVSARLADFLLERSDHAWVRLGLTHQEISQVIGTSRESVTALLGRFTVMGALKPVRRGYIILDEALLESIARGEMSVSPRHRGTELPAREVG